MLSLTRRPDQSIIIGKDIKITVLQNNHGQVRLGIEAPEDVKIWREELVDRYGIISLEEHTRQQKNK